jgi:uncharacterized protein YegL
MEWEQEISEHLKAAEIILLLVSPDFMNSDYCYSIEMKRALERHESGEARVIPVILRPVYWQGVLGNLQALPKDALPVTDPEWHNLDRAFYNITEGIRATVTMPTNQLRKAKNELSASPQAILPEKMKEDLPVPRPTILPLHFIWLIDCSGSMGEHWLPTLNFAMRRAIPEMQRVAQLTPHVQVLVRAIKISSGATWHIAKPTPVEKLQWRDLFGDGVLDLGMAFKMVADQLTLPRMEQRGLPPILVLITQGYATDDVARGLKAIMDQPWGRKAVRIGISVGEDADYALIQKFISNSEIKVLQADDEVALLECVKWASTVPIETVSALNLQDSKSLISLVLPLPPHYVRNQVSKDGMW